MMWCNAQAFELCKKHGAMDNMKLEGEGLCWQDIALGEKDDLIVLSLLFLG